MDNTISMHDLSSSARIRATQLSDKYGNVFALKARRGHQLTSLIMVDEDKYEVEKNRLIKGGWLEVVRD